MTLAIVSHGFGGASITFIRAHVRELAPGRTVLMCQNGTGAEGFGLPVLSELRSETDARGLTGRIRRRLRWAFHRYIDPGLRGADARRALAFLQRHDVRMVLAEYGTNGNLMRRVCRQAGVPLFVHFHGFDATRLARLPEIRRHYRRLFRDAAGIIAPSRFLADRLREMGCPDDKLHVCPNGVDVSTLSDSRRVPGRLLAIGRLVEKKAPHLTIRACAQVLAAWPGASLDLIGDGPLRPQCEAEIARHGLAGRVILHGAQDHEFVRAKLAEASVLVQHSVTASDGDMESFGISLVEAMACAIPVVTTDHNGFSETVADGETGLLVPEHDVDEMAAGILSLLHDPERAELMGRAGQSRARALFSQDRTIARLRATLGLDDPARMAQ